MSREHRCYVILLLRLWKTEMSLTHPRQNIFESHDVWSKWDATRVANRSKPSICYCSITTYSRVILYLPLLSLPLKNIEKLYTNSEILMSIGTCSLIFYSCTREKNNIRASYKEQERNAIHFHFSTTACTHWYCGRTFLSERELFYRRICSSASAVRTICPQLFRLHTNVLLKYLSIT